MSTQHGYYDLSTKKAEAQGPRAQALQELHNSEMLSQFKNEFFRN